MTAPGPVPDARRMRALAGAYGADLARWPEAERAGARAWIDAHPELARLILEEARALDGLMDAWRVPPPAADLNVRVLAPAPRLVRTARRRAFVLTLCGGAGLAAACLAGILTAPVLVPEPVAVVATQALPEVTNDEVLSEALTAWEAPSGDPADLAS